MRQLNITQIQNGYLVGIPPQEMVLPSGQRVQSEPLMHHCKDEQDVHDYIDELFEAAHLQDEIAQQKQAEVSAPRILTPDGK